MRHAKARVLIFAKAAQPGGCKTRLIPVLGPEGAADLHACLLADTLGRLAAAEIAPLELWCAPHEGSGPFPRLAAAYRLPRFRQRGTDLGQRMAAAATDALGRGAPVVLLGTDCPSLDGEYLAGALDALCGQDAVLGPAEDGGYVLLGLWRAPPALFRDIPWGTDQVAAITRERMRALGWRWVELATLWDLDRPEDLARYRTLRSAGG